MGLFITLSALLLACLSESTFCFCCLSSADDSTFHGILVRHIHRLLKEREQVREDERNWVLNEALSIRKLHNGGTFQNVLARKLDDVLVPIFSEIIALVDHDYNLNHFDPKNKNPPVYQFWLTMFRNQQLHYQEMVAGGVHREKVPGAGGRMAEDFKCQLPFSWQVKAAVDSLWYSAKSTAEGKFLLMQLPSLVPTFTFNLSLLHKELNNVLGLSHSPTHSMTVVHHHL